MPIVSPLIDACIAAEKSGTSPPIQVGSSGSAPAIRPSSNAQSSAVRASGPTVSSDCDSGIAPARLTRPTVVFSPVTPQKCAGMRIEPPASEPNAAQVRRARTAEPEPDAEPEANCAPRQGLRT